MLKRIYVDNFRSLVNFELNLEKVILFMGGNGSGKSSVFDALHGLRRLLVNGESADTQFPLESATRWDTRGDQTMEIELAEDSHTFRYRLVLSEGGFLNTHVLREELSVDNTRVFTRDPETGSLAAPGDAIRSFVVDPERSTLPLVRRRSDVVGRFLDQVRRLRVVSLRPATINSWCEHELRDPGVDFSDFAAWYRYLSQSRGPEMEEARDALRAVMPGLYGLRLRDSGRSEAGRKLVTEWRLPDGKKITYDFDELSDGQRALIALYTLLYAGGDEPTTIAVDEPDNFVALSEIQPWLGALSERPALQAILISHHPEILNMHALDAGIVFRRDDGGPTRVERFSADPGETLTPAELIARGWYRGAG